MSTFLWQGQESQTGFQQIIHSRRIRENITPSEKSYAFGKQYFAPNANSRFLIM
jgi:hypothetical protein